MFRIYEIVFKIYLLFVCILSYIMDLSLDSSILLSANILLVNILLLKKVKANYLLIIIFLFLLYSNYSIIYVNFVSKIDIIYTQLISQGVSVKSLNILHIFNVLLYLLFPKTIPDLNANQENIFINTSKQNTFIVILLIIALIVVFFVGFAAPSAIGERGHISPIAEYALLLFIFAFNYSGTNIKLQRIILLLIILYSLQNFLFGGRVLGLQFLLCAYFYMFSNKIPLKRLFIFVVPLFLFMILIGLVRGELLRGSFSFDSIWEHLLENGLALDTAYSSYFTSKTFVYVSNMVNNGLEFFQDFLLSIFLGESYNNEHVLSIYTFNYIYHSWGGILPFYFWYFLGDYGVIVSNLILMFYFYLLTRLSPSSSNLHKSIVVFFVCSCFRWYLYSPLVLFRSVLFLIIIYWLLKILDNLHIFKSK